MKQLFLAFLILPFISQAKEPCGQILVRKDKKSGIVTYTTPPSQVRATKWVNKKSTTLFLNFSIKGGSELPAAADREYDLNQLKGLFVQFTDGSTWRNDSAAVRYTDVKGTSVFSYPQKLDDQTLNLFTAKKIERFGLGRLTEKNIRYSAVLPDLLRCLTP